MSEIREARARRETSLRSRERVVESASAIAFVVTAAAFAVAARTEVGDVRIGTAATLVAMLAALGQVEFEVGRGAAVPTQLAFVPLAFLTPPGLLPLEVLAGYLFAACLGTGSLERRIVLAASSCWFCVGPALLLALTGSPRTPAAIGVLCAGAFVAQVLVDYAGWYLHEAQLGSGRRVSLQDAAWLYAIDAALTPLGLLVVLAAPSAGYALVLPLGVVALLALYRRERANRIDSLIELSGAYRGTALLLGCMIDGDDAYTAKHSTAVVESAKLVATELGITDPEVLREIEFAALLHDIGKIRIPKRILNKRGPLDARQADVMRLHPTIGADMLTSAGGLLATIAPAVRHHHERWDGGGYPDGLRGPRIPLAARIVAACDACNAMTTDRPYRRAMSAAAARAELAANAGGQFDPDIVRALLATLADERANDAKVA